jgi:hypothetical protein
LDAPAPHAHLRCKKRPRLGMNLAVAVSLDRGFARVVI